ncbi:spore coat protein, CotS family [Caloramator quimbayensis]|uniref:Spore coat protein, CotS family n=1 Tax=Caloramator quimbayensis TaxID=1147123 RepID=A0A1T4XA83_9CLOT|nr:CotS family spore coat protein [Caloramator quimbayensis]SKA86015.1 spore coat protein, CotS family [Caloramator quimbayensis]
MELLGTADNILFPIDELKSQVLSHYNFEILDIENIKFKDTEKQRAVYKVTTNKGIKCLKKVYYKEDDLLFLYSVIEWLNLRGIHCPKFISTKKGFKFVNYHDNLFILTDWIDGRKCDYDNIDDVKAIAENLGKIHKSSKNFYPIDGSKIRQSDKDYLYSYNKHFLQLLDISNSAFRIKDKFSKIYLDNFDYNIEKAKESIYILSQIDFSKKIGDDVSNCAICHLDYVNKNIIFSKDGKLHVIDFDRTMLDMPVHDISVFLRRILKREKTSWDFETFINAMESYEKIRKLSYDEYMLLYAILMFPQKFWKISRDYYKNIKECNKESFITILRKVTNQQKDHENFCIELKKYIFKKFKE